MNPLVLCNCVAGVISAIQVYLFILRKYVGEFSQMYDIGEGSERWRANASNIIVSNPVGICYVSGPWHFCGCNATYTVSQCWSLNPAPTLA